MNKSKKLLSLVMSIAMMGGVMTAVSYANNKPVFSSFVSAEETTTETTTQTETTTDSETTTETETTTESETTTEAETTTVEETTTSKFSNIISMIKSVLSSVIGLLLKVVRHISGF